MVSALNPAQVQSGTVSFIANHSFAFDSEPNSRFDSLKANISWIPIPSQAQIVEMNAKNGEVREEQVNVRRSNSADFTTRIKATIRTERNEPRIDNRVPFPFNDEATDEIRAYDEYLQEDELIQITPEVRSLSTTIAGQQDDLRSVVDSVAEWTATNIEYNLSTTNAEASLPSDVVLKNRNGVCDEITNLFIAQMRSLGVPARYVSGLAYTESDLFDSRWGAHGWAEVYFPGHGWVPYDPTYEQFGYVDGTHVVFSKGTGGEKYGTQYTWRANRVDVGYERNWHTLLKEHTEVSGKDVASTISVTDDAVGFGDTNEVTVTVTNARDYYQTVAATLNPTERLSYVEPRSNILTLAPGEQRNVSWNVIVDSDLNGQYRYTLPVVATVDGRDVRTEFTVSQREQSTVKHDSTTTSYEYTCKTGLDTYREGDNVTISCQTKTPTKICIDEKCGERSKEPTIATEADGISKTVTLRLPGLSTTTLVSVPVKAVPRVTSASAVWNTGNKTLQVTTNMTNRHAATTMNITVNGSVYREIIGLNPGQTNQTVRITTQPGYTANADALVAVGDGEDSSQVPVELTVTETRPWQTRVMDGVIAFFS